MFDSSRPRHAPARVVLGASGAVAVAIVMALFSACLPAGPPPSDGALPPGTDSSAELPPIPALPAGAAQGMVTAAAGGTLAGETGVVLEIPPGAMPADTEVTVIPLETSALVELDPKFLAGAMLGPDGLTLAQPAKLIVPLPEPWAQDDPPVELHFRGDDPGYAVPTGEFVQLSDDGLTAIFNVEHFCGRIAAGNCYGGAYEYLAHQWKLTFPECTLAQIAARVNAKYPDIHLPTDIELLRTKESIMSSRIQALADTFFEQKWGYESGEVVPDDVLDQMIAYRGQDRNVLMLFAPNLDQRRPPYSFYGRLQHAAVVDYYTGHDWEWGMFPNGQGYVPHGWSIRHAFPFWLPGFRRFMNGTNLAYFPLKKTDPRPSAEGFHMGNQDLTTFKQAPMWVSMEVYRCGEPGCGAPLPDWPTDSEEYKSHPFTPLDQRERNGMWSAVHIYVERAENNPCNRLAGCWKLDFTKRAGGTVWLLLKFDREGRLDGMWQQMPAGDDASADIWGELVCFQRPLPGMFAQLFSDRHATVTLEEPQTGFSLRFGYTTWVVENGERLERPEEITTWTITANFSQNEPGEWWQGDCLVHAHDYYTEWVDDELVEREQDIDHNQLIHAVRVDCLDPGSDQVHSLEEQWAELEAQVGGGSD